ncbi:hypothetical protein CPB83DRAFT_780995 [Crepidotus variabilis]|uniref:Uncharacterized protein n=1 Tax=Crepidotus variabilis TaxID=179855 RepID=A0A9P6ETA3_9AGAR|nr:hypothetical protein CPB83DRAFT_780995 [Crepidotus variabilis]
MSASNPLKYLTRKAAIGATTKNPATTNFNHLKSFPRAWLIRRSKYDSKLKSVRPTDRIKWWNIVPGDQIRLRGDSDGKLHEVLSINRLSNRVFLKNTAAAAKEDQPLQTKNYHYSRCQLYLGEFDVPSRVDPGVSKTQPVFALRVGTSQPAWDRFQKRWVWRRYAVATTPKLPDWGTGQRRRVPWPVRQPVKYPEASLYDTPIEEVAKITYKLPPFDVSRLAPIPKAAPEQAYLDTIYNPHREVTYDPSAPFETYLTMELANPHSRAKKMHRWKIYQTGIHALRKKITGDELQYLDGRTVREAKADAAFKWRETVAEQQKKHKKARWMHSAQMIQWERKTRKKASKEDRLRRRLTELVLSEQPNQVIPASLKQATKERAA